MNKKEKLIPKNIKVNVYYTLCKGKVLIDTDCMREEYEQKVKEIEEII